MLQRLRERRRNGERGAALVEFAILAPFLILLLLGIIEFGYKFGQFNELRHAVRETARYAAVSNPDRVTPSTITGFPADPNDVAYDIRDVACSSLDLPGGTYEILTTRTGGDIGDTGTVTIQATLPSLTGAPLITAFVPTTLSNTAEFRLEQVTSWTAIGSLTALACP